MDCDTWKRSKGDQVIDSHFFIEEIALWIQHVYQKYALEDAEERFAEFDTDKDGVVSWEEYNMAAHDQLFNFDESTILDDPEQESLRHVRAPTSLWQCEKFKHWKVISSSHQLYLKERRRFNFADLDGTPGLNVTEFLAFTHPSEMDHMAVRSK